MFLQPYNRVQIKDYYEKKILTWNHIIVRKLLSFDPKTWNHANMCKVFVLGTWYPIILCEQMI